MCKQTLKSSAALIGVRHEIFTNRCAWRGTWLSAGTPITPHLCFLPQHTITSLFNGRKSSRWARWPQLPTTPTRMKYSARICNLYDCLKNRKENKQTPVYRFSCPPPKTTFLLWMHSFLFFSFSSLESCGYEDISLLSTSHGCKVALLFRNCHNLPSLWWSALCFPSTRNRLPVCVQKLVCFSIKCCCNVILQLFFCFLFYHQ